MLRCNKRLIQLGVGVFFTAVAATAVAADDNGSGTINFSGTILDAPCAIDASDVDKTVDLGQTTMGYLDSTGHSDPVDVTIHLTNCMLSGAASNGDDLTKADVTFSSTATDTSDISLLANTDSAGAQGVGVRILDTDDNPITLGNAVEVPLQVTSSEQTLTFHAWMESISSIATTPGNVLANATYTISYL